MVGSLRSLHLPAIAREEASASADADRQTFANLYRRHVTEIYRYCFRRLGTREAAEDATSQVFTQALAAFGASTFSAADTADVRPWLFTIAHNVVIDDWRRQRAEPLPDDPGQLLDRAPPVEEQAIVDDSVQRLHALLGELTPDQRQVVELRLSGLSGEEIAAVLGRRRGAVDALQFRAVAKLRELFAASDAASTKEPPHAKS